MAVWNKPPERDPREIAQLQAQIDADPVVQAFRAGYGSPNDPWTRGKGGKVTNPNQLGDYVRSKYGLPSGYDVSQDGRVVYTNETPILKQALLAATPILGVTALGKAFGDGGAGTPGLESGQGANAGGLGNWLDTMQPVGNSMTGGLPFAPEAGAGLLAGGNAAINAAIDKGMSPPVDGSTAPLGGLKPPSATTGNLADRLGDWFKDPRNLAGLAGIAGTLAMRPNGGMSPEQQAAQAQANRMSAITEARMRRVDPLHQAVTQLAFGRLPMSARNGLTLNNVPLPE